MYQSIPAVPIPPGPPPGLRSFPNPGGWAIVKIVQPEDGDPSWRLANYNMADFARKDTEFVCKIICLHEL